MDEESALEDHHLQTRDQMFKSLLELHMQINTFDCSFGFATNDKQQQTVCPQRQGRRERKKVEEKEPFILVISTNILIKEEANIIKY